jgi:hypothetical protein
MRELALVRETAVRSQLRKGQVLSCLQELPGTIDATGKDGLVRRKAGGRLELIALLPPHEPRRRMLGSVLCPAAHVEEPVASSCCGDWRSGDSSA